MADQDETIELQLLPDANKVGAEAVAEARLQVMRACSNGREPQSRCDNLDTAVMGTKVELIPYRQKHVPQMHQWFMDDEDLADTMCGCTTLPQEYRQQAKWRDSTEHLSFLISSRADFGQVIGDVHLLYEKDEPEDDEDEATAPAVEAVGDAEGAKAPGLPAADEVPQNLDGWSREDVLGPRADSFFHEAEILVMIADPAFRRGGFAQEAVVRLMQYAVAVIGTKRFIAKIDDENEASMGLFTKKLGFRVYERNEDFEMTHVELSGERLVKTLFDTSEDGTLASTFGQAVARHFALPESTRGFNIRPHLTQQQLDNANAAIDKLLNFKQTVAQPGAPNVKVEIQPSRFFDTPVDLDYYEGYTDVVKRPLDLGTVKQNLNKDVYTTPEEFRVDVQTTFANLLVFQSDPRETGHQFPDPRVAAFGLLDHFQEVYADYAHSGTADSMPTAEKRKCRKQLELLLLHRTATDKKKRVWTSGPFVVPVLNFLLPGYQRKVKEPMDLSVVAMKLNTDGYATPAAFHADVALTFTNALKYGGNIQYEDPDTKVSATVETLAKSGLEVWQKITG